MSKRIQIACTSCAQPLVVEASSAGKQARCPKCQALTMIPSPAAPKTKVDVVEKVATKPKTQVVACPSCQTKLSVRLMATAAKVSCPKCRTEMRIPASKAPDPKPRLPTQNTSSPARPVVPVPVGPVASAPAQPKATARKAPVSEPPAKTASESEPILDLGQIELPQNGTSPSMKGRASGRRGLQASAFLAWMNSHRWVTLIVVLNLLGLITCIGFPPGLLIMAIFGPVGFVLIGLLFVPRLYFVRHCVQAIRELGAALGTAAVNLGFGGVLTVVLLVMFQTLGRMPRVANNPNLDFSGFTDPNNIIGFISGFVVFFGTIALMLLVWHLVGFVRLAVIGYCGALTFMLFGLVVGLAATSLENRQGQAMSPSRSANLPRLPGRRPYDSGPDRASATARPWMNDKPPMLDTGQSPSQFPERVSRPTFPSEGGQSKLQTDMPKASGRTSEAPRARNTPTPKATRRVTRRPISLPVPSGSVQVEPTTPLERGIKLQSCYAKKWYQVTVMAVHDDGTVSVNWDDWPAFTYDMTRDDLIIAESVLNSISQ